MEKIDYHVHSDNSFDGKEKIIDLSNRACELGLSEICFTEHYCMDPMDVSYNVLDNSRYSDEIKECQEILKGKISIKKGLEIGEPYMFKEDLNNSIKDMNLDFIIGSIHNIDHLKLRSYIKDKDKKYIYNRYFNEIYKMVTQGEFDVVGHLDLMKRYAYSDFGNYDFKDCEELLASILKEVIGRNKGIEINTSGLRDNVKELYPSVDVIKLYKQLGGEIITIGSDSHTNDFIGSEFLTVIKILKDAGFKYIFKYEKRNPIGVKII